MNSGCSDSPNFIQRLLALKTWEMRDKSTLPFLGEKMNSYIYRKPSLPVTILDSIPENEDGSSHENLKEQHEGESKRDEAKKRWHKLSTAITLPKLNNISANVSYSGLDRKISSPYSNGFLNITNMRLSPREDNEKAKREDDIKCSNYLLFEPAISDRVSGDIDLSRYAFRPALERIPETDGERLLSEHSKKQSNSAEREKHDSPAKMKKKQVRSLKSLDLFYQQQQQLARKGPPIRVWFSHKQQNNRPATPDNFTKKLQDSCDKSQELQKDFVLPRIILYQWEVHEKQPKIKSLGHQKQLKGLPKVHRIPTASQANQPNERNGDSIDDNVRSDSPWPKIPQAPPPTPRSHRCPSSLSENVPAER